MACRMNKLTLICAFAICANISQAQTFNEWFRQKKTQKKYLLQQIAALKVYLDYLKKGYKIVDKGLTIVGDIKQGKFGLDIEYLESLGNVNSAVSGSAKVASIIAYQKKIMIEFRRLNNLASETTYFTNEEKKYVESVYANMLRESELSLDELDRVLSNSDFEMKDDERVKRVDALYVDMKDKYTFTKSFSNSTQVLIAQRNQEDYEVRVQENLMSK
jgi:hypothetical protein